MKWLLKTAKVGAVALAVLLAVVVTALPFAVRWQAVAWLEQQGLEASIGYVDIRPVLGAVQINDVRVEAANGERLAIAELHANIAWRPLRQQWLRIEHVMLDGVAVDLVTGPGILRVGGIPIALSGSDRAVNQESGSAALQRLSLEQLELHDLRFCYSRVNERNERLASQCATLGELSQVGELELGLGAQGTFSLPGLQLSELQWSDRQQPLSLAAIDSLTVTDVASPDMASWQLGELHLAGLALLPDTAQALLLDSLSLVELSVAEAISAGQLSLNSVSVQLQPDASGALAFAPALMARLGELAPPPATGASAADTSASPLKLALQQFDLARLDVASDRPLLGLAGLDMAGFALQGADISLARLRFANLGVLPGTDDALVLEKLVLTGLSAGDNIAIDRLSLGNTRIHLQAGQRGELTFAPALLAQLSPSPQQPSAEATEGSAAEQPAMGFSLGQFSSAGISVNADRELLSLQSLQLQQLHFKDASFALDQLAVNALSLLAPATAIAGATHYVSVPALTLEGLAKARDELGLERLTITDPALFLHRNDRGELSMLTELAALSGQSAAGRGGAVPQPTAQDTAPLHIRLGELRIGENGQLQVWDESVSPPLQQQFSGLDLVIRHLDASRPAEGGGISLKLGVNRFGYLKLSGDLAPFGDSLNSAIGGELNGLDVRDLSGYAGKYIGYHLDQGTLDADIDVKVRQGVIDALVTTRFNKLEVSAIPEADLPEGAEQLGVPLEFALALLRDNDGMIELKLPIGGNIHSPDFSLNHIIGKVLFKVIGETVINYYLPFGLLAKSLVQDSLASLAFQPVAFAPGAAELDAPAVANLDKLAQMLQSRQQLHLVFCAPATLQDWRANFAPDEPPQEKTEESQRETSDKAEAVPEPVITPEQADAMTALADRRTEVAKAHLVEAGVKPGQVIPCSGAFEQAGDRAPEMAISIGQ